MDPPNEPRCCGFGSGGQKGSQTHPVAADEKLLVEELNQLSVPERELVYNEIHGVAETVEETPEFLQRCCQELQAEVKKVALLKRRAYDRAVFLKPSLEYDVKFQLMFLRAERYDAALAARRICLYFKNKIMLFGEEKLVKDITLDDLDEEDIEASRITGFFTRIPEKDQSGRAVLFIESSSHQFRSWQNLTRYNWYVLMNEFTDEDTQKTGFVNVTRVGRSEISQQRLQMIMIGTPLLTNSLPIRFVAFHFCFGRAGIPPIVSIFQKVIGTQNRVRFRAHFGSEVECQYSLMTFGIRIPDALIFGSNKEWGDMVTKYISERTKIEQEQHHAGTLQPLPPGLCALHPNAKDVLLGRGSWFQSFPGNKAKVAMVDEYRDRYFSSNTRLDKTFLAIEIYQRITSAGGRFLERVEGQGWKMVDREVGEQKIARALRNRFTMEQSGSTRPGHQKHEGPDSPRVGGLERTKKRIRRDLSGNDNDIFDG